MKKANLLKSLILFSAFFEGVSSLGIELYALRITSFFVGHSSAVTGIILAMILLACALGYYVGGRISQGMTKEQDILSKAFTFFLSANAVYLLAAFIQIPILYEMMNKDVNPMWVAVIMGGLFGFGVFLGCSAVPLLAQYLAVNSHKQDVTGRYAGLMVAITTLGSVIGSTIMPILLIPFLGLNYALFSMICSILLASICVLLLLKKGKFKKSVLIGFSLALGFCISVYNTLPITSTRINDWIIHETIRDTDNHKLKWLGTQAYSVQSCWDVTAQMYCVEYNKYLHQLSLIPNSREVTIIGGAGMTAPFVMAKENTNLKINVVELDEQVKPIAETFLEQPLPHNIHMLSMDGRYYLNKLNHQIDVFILDAFNHFDVATPLFTLDALLQMKNKSRLVLANIILLTDKPNDYSKTLLATWLKAFPESYIIKTGEDNNQGLANFVVCSTACGMGATLLKDSPYSPKDYHVIHTDNKPILEFYSHLWK